MNRPCYHCASNEALPHSNFCAACQSGSRPLFYPNDSRPGMARRLKTGLLYTGAAAAAVWLIVKTVEFVLTVK